MKLVIGLGNPGTSYKGTRHNIGWEAVSETAEKLAAKFRKKPEFKAEIAETNLGAEKILLVHPLTYMNLSGDAVGAIIRFFKAPLSNLLVVQDEMDYAEGEMAFAFKNGAAGHNGILSIQQALGSTEFARLRIGIGRPIDPIDPADYVLGKAPKTIDLEKASQAIMDWIQLGTSGAMNLWNRSGNRS